MRKKVPKKRKKAQKHTTFERFFMTTCVSVRAVVDRRSVLVSRCSQPISRFSVRGDLAADGAEVAGVFIIISVRKSRYHD